MSDSSNSNKDKFGYQPQKNKDRNDGRRVTGGYTPIKNEDSQGKPPKKP